MFRIGVDIGGTFTDFAIWRRETDGYVQIASHKLPSTRPNYAAAVIAGIEEIADSCEIGRADDVTIVHGTTVSTNAIIERSQPPLALLTTAGFRDIVEIARLRLDKPVDLFNRRVRPLVDREHVFEVVERLRPDGSVDVPLDVDSLLAAAEALRGLGIETLAICFLHAYRNADHERQALHIIRDRFPELEVMASHEVWPQKSEYERAIVTILNLYVKKLMGSYIAEIDSFLAKRLPKARLHVTKSNGGAMSSPEAVRLPVHTLLSGPAAGVTGARELARMLGAGDVLTMDMGGTSTDVSLVQAERTTITAQSEVGDFPLLLPVTAIEALGAGGGSLVWLDEGVLKVGPRSAGSMPGPACYGLGGTAPTLTDAYLLCNYLPSQGLLGGKLPLSRDHADAAFAKLAETTGTDAATLADAAIAVATSNMLAKVLPFLARLGIEPSELTLMMFGGAGGLHGPLFAAELGIRRVLVPRLPSVFCAFGCLVADLVHDAVRSVRGRPLDAQVLQTEFTALAAEGNAWLAQQGGVASETRHFADMRYAAQAFTVPVDVTVCVASGSEPDACAQAFHDEHLRLFDHCDRSAPIAFDELRTRSIGRQPKPHAEPPEARHCEPVEAKARRDLRIAGATHADSTVYDREALKPGWEGRGPAIIEQDMATILLPPGFCASVGPLGDLWLVRED